MPVVIPHRLRGPGLEIHSPTRDVCTHKLFIGKLLFSNIIHKAAIWLPIFVATFTFLILLKSSTVHTNEHGMHSYESMLILMALKNASAFE